MNKITYAKLTAENFNEDSLNSFNRYQEIKQSLRKVNDMYVYVDNPYIEDWDLEKRKQVAREIVKALQNNKMAYGAFCNGDIVGFIYLGGEFWGTEKQYTELTKFHVTNGYRKNGIGKALFILICKEARELGAKKLYISANSSKESQDAYTHLGCLPAKEVNKRLSSEEPFDIQMEFVL